jgi:hypothetical protein
LNKKDGECLFDKVVGRFNNKKRTESKKRTTDEELKKECHGGRLVVRRKKQERVNSLKSPMNFGFNFEHDDPKAFIQYLAKLKGEEKHLHLIKTLAQRFGAHDPMIVGFFYQNVFSLVKVSILNAPTLFVD